jgi:hypothetical protein
VRAACVAVCRGAREVVAVVGVGAALLVVAGAEVRTGVDASCRAGADADVHAVSAISAAPTSRQLGNRTNTPSGCHATPMRMRGCAVGVSHFMIVTSRACEIATQPAVARPSVTCRKNALPFPWCTPPGAFLVL